MQDDQYLKTMFEDIKSVVSYYPTNHAWSREKSKYLKKRIIEGIRKEFESLNASQTSEVTSTSTGSTIYYSMESSCANACAVLSPKSRQRRGNNDDLFSRILEMKISDEVIPEEVRRDPYRHNHELELMTEDEEDEWLQEEDSPEENSETSMPTNLNQTISDLQSFQRSMRNESANFNLKMEELRELMLQTSEKWTIISKKLKGIPVVERRKDMLKELLSDYKVCFTRVNIKLPSSYQQLVDNVFPKVSLKQKQALMSYLAGAVVGNSYFKELMNSLAEVHENFCGEDYCKVR